MGWVGITVDYFTFTADALSRAIALQEGYAMVMDKETARVLAVICDRLESIASQNEDTARVISAIRGAAKSGPGFEERYGKLYSDYLGLAANRTADAELQEIRQMLSQVLRPTA